jgi:hypothetical protein
MVDGLNRAMSMVAWINAFVFIVFFCEVCIVPAREREKRVLWLKVRS